MWYYRRLADGVVVMQTRPEHAEQLEQLQRDCFPTLDDAQRFKAAHYRRHIELFPDGQSRTVLFSHYLELHNEPKEQRLRLTPDASDPGIVLDYRRMGFDRLVDLIMTYGDFETSNSDSPAS